MRLPRIRPYRRILISDASWEETIEFFNINTDSFLYESSFGNHFINIEGRVLTLINPYIYCPLRNKYAGAIRAFAKDYHGNSYWIKKQPVSGLDFQFSRELYSQEVRLGYWQVKLNNDDLYILYPYGESIKKYVNRNKKQLTKKNRYELSIRVLLKLSQIHGNDVVLRDIQPKDIILDNKGEVHFKNFKSSKSLIGLSQQQQSDLMQYDLMKVLQCFEVIGLQKFELLSNQQVLQLIDEQFIHLVNEQVIEWIAQSFTALEVILILICDQNEQLLTYDQIDAFQQSIDLLILLIESYFKDPDNISYELLQNLILHVDANDVFESAEDFDDNSSHPNQLFFDSNKDKGSSSTLRLKD